MHIPDGMLSTSVCLAGYGVTFLATSFSIKRINQAEDKIRNIPKASLLTAAFFLLSLISIPVPPASIHLLLNGLLGALLGYFAFPAVLVALFLQAVLFGHGGLTTMGINALIMGLPNSILGFIIGFLGLALSVMLFALILIAFIPGQINAEAERVAIMAVVAAHIPLALVEGLITALALNYIQKVKPSLLQSDNTI
jgi:cobalt/nickel transport system permease protein